MQSSGPSPSQSKGCPWHGKLSEQAAIEHRWDLAVDARTLQHPEFAANSLIESAQHAWRNAARCIGRLHWKSLQVYDARAAQTPAEVAAALAQHLRLAAGKGRIESWTTLFRPWETLENEIRL
jgi:nitric oxide synthase oxygenase domain/subunit